MATMASPRENVYQFTIGGRATYGDGGDCS